MNVRALKFSSIVLFQVLYTLGILIMAIFLMAIRIRWISAQPYPIATDSFFYLEEFRAYKSGMLGYYTTYSPFFMAWGIMGRIIPVTPQTLYGLIVLTSLVLLSYALIRGAVDRGWSLQEAVLLGTIPWASDLIFFRHYAFPQQAFGVALVLFAFLPRHKNRIKVLFLAVCGALSHLSSAMIVALQASLVVWRFQKIMIIIMAVVVTGYLFWTERLIFDFTLASGLAPSLVQACTFANCSDREWHEVIWFGVLLVSAGVFGFRFNGIWLLSALVLLLPIWNSEGHMLYRLGITSLWIILACCVQTRYPRGVFLMLMVSFLAGQVCLNGKVYTESGLPYRLLESRQASLQQWMANPSTIEAQHGEDFRLRYAWNGKGIREGNVTVTRRKIKGCRPLGSGDEGQCVALGEGWYLVRG